MLFGGLIASKQFISAEYCIFLWKLLSLKHIQYCLLFIHTVFDI